MKNAKDNSWIYVTPLAILIFLVPIVVNLKIIPLDIVNAQNWNGSRSNFDFFSYNKMICLIVLASISLLMILLKCLIEKKSLKRTYIYIPMLIYISFVFLSFAFSKYRGIALTGFPDRYEGTLAIASYIIIMFTAINLVDNEASIKLIISFLLLSATIIGIIGIFQYFGHDFFNTYLGKNIIIPYKYSQYKSQLQFKFGEHTIYSTLYNPNYVGSYMSMVFPLSVILFLFTKDIKRKIIIGMISFLMLFNLIGCGSRGGMLGAIFALTLGLIILGKKHLFSIKIPIKVTLLSIVAFIFICISYKGGILNSENLQVKSQGLKLKGIELNKNILTISTSDAVMRLQNANKDIIFKDEKYKEILAKINMDSGNINFEDKRYKPYTFKMYRKNGIDIINMKRSDLDLSFVIRNNTFKYFDERGIIYDIKSVQSFGFKGKESLGSTRGYIWSRCIPMIRNTRFLGYGADTFSIYFPQYDYIEKFNVYGTTSIVVDKPHSLYINTAISTGIISLLMLLIMFITYFISSMKIYLNKSFENIYEVYGLAIFLGITGYMVSSLFNDSVIGVAPVFWIIFGIGISINHELKRVK